MQKLEGKVALVTGAARRIGAVTVKMLHQQGASVVIHYRNSKQDAETLCDELNALRSNSCYIQQAELADVDSLKDMIDAVKITEDHWDNLFASNLKAPLFLSQAAAPYLTKNQGCIVNMVDIHAERPLAEHPVYCAAKAGLSMLTKSLAKELGPNVRVNGVSPGAILWPEADADKAEASTEHQELLAKTSLKREGSPEDIARAIEYLVIDAPYVTGHIIPVDGGRLLNQ